MGAVVLIAGLVAACAEPDSGSAQLMGPEAVGATPGASTKCEESYRFVGADLDTALAFGEPAYAAIGDFLRTRESSGYAGFAGAGFQYASGEEPVIHVAFADDCEAVAADRTAFLDAVMEGLIQRTGFEVELELASRETVAAKTVE